ncbi:MAG: transglutaminase-like enzyme predicted cysteine protease [Planctomycetota bacterium]|nr:transglutaminase-like enzyme predicted cysteine protease [Planctomycetota bacterium]
MNLFARRGWPCGICLALILASTPAFGQESWDAIYVGSAKVGHMRVRVEPLKDRAGRDLVRVRVDWDLTFDRGNNRAHMRQLYGTIETPEGSVLRLDTRTQASNDDIRTFGDVKDGRMNLTIESGGKAQAKEIAWDPDVRGPYAAELSLSRKPLKPGEARDVKTYMPDLNKICITKLVAKGPEKVEIGGAGQTRELLRVEQVVTDDAGTALPGMKTTLWVDGTGQILRSHTDLLGGMDTFRTTEAGALGDPGGGKFDLLTSSIIKCRKIAGSEATRNVAYRITMPEDEPGQVFPRDRRQTPTAGNEKTIATLVVKTFGPKDGAPEEEPGPEYSRANPLIDSEDLKVIELTRRAVGKLTDPWAKAVAIQKWVSVNLTDKNFSTAFATAAAVARNLKAGGDCSEHSVLVAAMCRAAGVPSRCAIGLVYADNIGGTTISGFGPHMWNEVYVNRRWVAIDAAYNQSDVDATHLKLAASSLDGTSPFEVFLPVLKVFNKITIEPVEVR